MLEVKGGEPKRPTAVRRSVARKAVSGRGPRIRCPLCQWQPRAEDRWRCMCLHLWNTFDTRGRCPSCGFQWTVTACLRCERFSLHEAWYESAAPEG